MAGDVGGNGQGSDLVGGDVGGNSQDLFQYRWSAAVVRMKASHLVNGRYGAKGRLSLLARAVHELYRDAEPQPQDLASLAEAYLTPNQIIKAIAAGLLERLGEADPRSIIEISVLLGADR